MRETSSRNITALAVATLNTRLGGLASHPSASSISNLCSAPNRRLHSIHRSKWPDTQGSGLASVLSTRLMLDRPSALADTCLRDGS